MLACALTYGREEQKSCVHSVCVMKNRACDVCEACQSGDVIRKHTWMLRRMQKAHESTEGNAICK